MSTLRCQAKDPATCSYHRPNAGAIQLAKLNKATADFDAAEKAVIESSGESAVAAYFDTRSVKEEAENAYYATYDGLEALKKQLNTTSPATFQQVSSRIELANHQIAQAEKQNHLENDDSGTLEVDKTSTYEVPKFTNSGESRWPETTGSKYNPALTTKEIATNITADLKQAQKEGYLPKHLKFKLSTYASTTTNSVAVLIIGASDKQIYENGDAYRDSPVTARAKEVETRVEGITNAYNWKQMDAKRGQINTNKYYSEVGFEGPTEKHWRLKKEAESLRKREANKEAKRLANS